MMNNRYEAQEQQQQWAVVCKASYVRQQPQRKKVKVVECIVYLNLFFVIQFAEEIFGVRSQEARC